MEKTNHEAAPINIFMFRQCVSVRNCYPEKNKPHHHLFRFSIRLCDSSLIRFFMNTGSRPCFCSFIIIEPFHADSLKMELKIKLNSDSFTSLPSRSNSCSMQHPFTVFFDKTCQVGIVNILENHLNTYRS